MRNPVLITVTAAQIINIQHTSNENPLLILVVNPQGVITIITRVIRVLLLPMDEGGGGGKVGHGSSHERNLKKRSSWLVQGRR